MTFVKHLKNHAMTSLHISQSTYRSIDIDFNNLITMNIDSDDEEFDYDFDYDPNEMYYALQAEKN